MIQDIITAKIRKEVFWVVVCAMFVAAAGLMFWLNYSFDQEQGKLFSDLSFGIVRPPHAMIDTSSWETYGNKKLGFSFKYSPELRVFPCYGQMLFCLNIGEKNLVFQDNGFAVRLYSLAGLPSSEEDKFVTEEIGGIQWRVNRDTIQYFRTQHPKGFELRVFANKNFSFFDTIIKTFSFVQ